VLGALGPFRIAIAGFGRKPGGDTVLSMLLDDNDLASSELKMTSEHVYRTFASLDSTDAIERARKSGSVSAVRVLRDDVVMRSLRIRVTPFVSAGDAESSVARAVENVRVKFRRATGEQRYIEGVDVSDVSHVIVREILGAGPQGPAGDRLLAGAIDNYLICLAFQAQGNVEELWPWDEISEITTQQAHKIRGALNT
jgi:hypothetical protein